MASGTTVGAVAALATFVTLLSRGVTRRVPVLIAGGGPAGLTASILLARHGIRSLVAERHPGPSILPRATAINVRVMEIFRVLGIGQEMVE